MAQRLVQFGHLLIVSNWSRGKSILAEIPMKYLFIIIGLF